MSRKRSNLDEMQEQKLLHIEHVGYWLAFWGLAAAIFIQMISGKGDFIGEAIVLVSLSVYLVASCIKNGLWDRRLKPNLKTNLVVSLIGGTVSGSILFFSSYMRYDHLVSSIFTGVVVFASTFVLCLAALTLCVQLYKRRTQNLEEKGDN